MKSKDTLRVIYSSDDNYARHLGASVYSLLDCNRDFEKTEVYIIENNISDENKKKLAGVAEGFVNASVDFISFDKWRWNGSGKGADVCCFEENATIPASSEIA